MTSQTKRKNKMENKTTKFDDKKIQSAICGLRVMQLILGITFLPLLFFTIFSLVTGVSRREYTGCSIGCSILLAANIFTMVYIFKAKLNAEIKLVEFKLLKSNSDIKK